MLFSVEFVDAECQRPCKARSQKKTNAVKSQKWLREVCRGRDPGRWTQRPIKDPWMVAAFPPLLGGLLGPMSLGLVAFLLSSLVGGGRLPLFFLGVTGATTCTQYFRWSGCPGFHGTFNSIVLRFLFIFGKHQFFYFGSLKCLIVDCDYLICLIFGPDLDCQSSWRLECGIAIRTSCRQESPLFSTTRCAQPHAQSELRR